MKSYEELTAIADYYDRFRYLRIGQKVSEETFGCHRYINQLLYTSSFWRTARSKAIIRDSVGDNVMDMAHPEMYISGIVICHHINPITLEMIEKDDPLVYDLNNIVCVSDYTHKAIHYGDERLLPQKIVERRPNDTIPWR